MLTFNPDGSITIANDKRYLTALRNDLQRRVKYLENYLVYSTEDIRLFYPDISTHKFPLFSWNQDNPNLIITSNLVPDSVRPLIYKIYNNDEISSAEQKRAKKDSIYRIEHLYKTDPKLAKKAYKQHTKDLEKAQKLLDKCITKNNKRKEQIEIYKKELQEINTLIKLCHDNS